MSLRDLGRRALIASRTLARLALQRELVVGPAFVQETADRDAIAKALNDLGVAAAPDDFTDLVAALNDMTARQRLADIKAAVDEAIPGLLEEFDDWPGLVKNTRDYLAHWLLGDDDDDYVPPSEDDKMLVYISLPWALRTLLLYRAAKLDANLMRQGYAEKPEYEMFRANVRAITHPPD
jgi:hypothetical protein